VLGDGRVARRAVDPQATAAEELGAGGRALAAGVDTLAARA
jgi:hypothetical protein